MDNCKIIGKDKKLIEILEISKKVAKTDTTVIIYGESGTGKELFAHYIYENSLRKDNKFVIVNCAAIPEHLLENELFGHKKGAFTDATTDYIGKFGYANGGTIFLDEIGEISPLIQSKLLRILQYKTYEPLGSNEELYSDVRIIAATNKDLLKLVKEKKFREDLFYRLNVVPITIPPLRERKDDIELLANYYLDYFNKKMNKSIIGFDKDVMNILKNNEWHGNIRELINVIERSVVLCEDKIIKKIYLFDNEIINNKKSNKVLSLKDALFNFKKEFIMKSLEQNNFNQTKTAKQLKIQRTYLVRLIKELGIKNNY